MKLNILFLDDEVMVLDALRRSLRSQAGEWTMHFADSVDKCWHLLESEPIDVIVTDMQMPGIDGSAFLATVRDRMPGTVRMVLSGFKDRQNAVHTESAHRFLMKPIMATSLVRHISSATARPMSEKSELIRGASSLVTTAATKSELTRLLENPHAEINDISRIVRDDPGLCAKVLQLANSSVFGLRNAELDIKLCLAAIQLESLRTLVSNDKLFWSFPAGDSRDAAVRAIIDHGRAAAATTNDSASYFGALLHVGGTLLDLGQGIAETPECDCASSSNTSLDLMQLWGIPASVIQELQHFATQNA